MADRIMKYNPAYLPEDVLVRNFVVRQGDLALLANVVEENSSAAANQHLLVLGPRGSGKTTLALRLAAEIRRSEALGGLWYPVVFPEESYEVASAGELWLEALSNVADQTGEERWRKVCDELKGERDDDRLRERALGQLLDFADSREKRLLLVIENIHMLLGQQISNDEAWKIRHTLQNEPRLMLLATAIDRFDSVENSSLAMYEMFITHHLPPLNDDESNEIWRLVAGRPLVGQRIRPVRILTGGNLRLLTIIAKFGAERSFERLLDELVSLIDDHTEYFKSHLDNLAPTERKVYLALAELWDFSGARAIAEAARLDVNKTSSLLNRLAGKGAVLVESKGKRAKLYAVAERMYNIYYLMRKRGAPSDRVRAAVNFMVGMYGPESAAKLLTQEAATLDAEHCRDHCLAFMELVREIKNPETIDGIARHIPRQFQELPHLGEKIKLLLADKGNKQLADEGATIYRAASELLHQGLEQTGKNDCTAAIITLDKAARLLEPDSTPMGKAMLAIALTVKSAALGMLGKFGKAIDTANAAIERFGGETDRLIVRNIVGCFVNKAKAFHELGQIDEALAAYNEAIDHLQHGDSKYGIDLESIRLASLALLRKASIFLNRGKSYDALMLYKEIIELVGDSDDAELLNNKAAALINNGYALMEIGNYEEALKLYDNVIAQFEAIGPMETLARALVNKGLVLAKLGKSEDELQLYNTIIERFGRCDIPELLVQAARAGKNKGLTLERLGRVDEAMAQYDEVVARFGGNAHPDVLEHVVIALECKGCLLGSLGRLDEAAPVFAAAISRIGDRAEWNFQVIAARVTAFYGGTIANLGKTTEAEKSLRRAIELDTELNMAHTMLVDLLLQLPKRKADAVKAAKEAVAQNPRNAKLLHEMAKRFFAAKASSIVAPCEDWARRAVALEPENARYRRTLACVLCVRGRGREALNAAKSYLADEEAVADSIPDAIELFVELAAGGNAREALAILAGVPAAAKHLEPLVVALRLYAEEEVNAAVEIADVARDLVKRIEERAADGGKNLLSVGKSGIKKVAENKNRKPLTERGKSII